MSWISKIIGAAWIIACSWTSVMAEQSYCSTLKWISVRANEILDTSCNEQDDVTLSLQCSNAMVRVILMLQGCGENGQVYLNMLEDMVDKDIAAVNG